MFNIKRVYEKKETSDGYRVLVDRFWPRGISKENAQIDLWLQEIAPSNTLRKWFAHDPSKWDVFKKKYKEELTKKEACINQLKDIEKQHKQVILLYSAKDTEHNNALVLLVFITT